MTDGSQEFCLRWNNHQATIISVFDYLLENETLVDCTLAAEGQYLKAHKVVLCACSPYLELLLSQHNDKHPILIFKDIKYNELKCMIEYMYKGEVNIAQDQLNHFLKAAESLQIKGLSESEEDAAPQTSIPAPRPPPPRAPPVQRTQPRPISSSVAVESPKRINRNEAASPTRKRRRLPIQGRPSLSGDDASNASESHLDQSNCDVPSNVQPSSDNAVAKLETNSELILEPKTEYDDNSVEDITLDDDEEDYSQAGTSMDNSQMNFSGWQGMDKSGGDEVFTGQDSGAQNSQEMIFIECSFCHKDVRNSAKSMFDHKCFGVSNQYTCLVCNQKEQQAWKIKRHYLKHTQEKNFTCDYCNYKTAYVNDLKKHTRKHTGEKPYRCEICPYAAADSKSLRAHYKIHQKDSVKTLYFCSVCSKRYYNKEKLVEHFVLHDVNRHKCQVCEDSFENAWELELHLSELHHIIQVEESNKSEKDEEVLVSQKDDDDDHGKNDDKKDDASALSLSSIF